MVHADILLYDIKAYKSHEIKFKGDIINVR